MLAGGPGPTATPHHDWGFDNLVNYGAPFFDEFGLGLKVGVHEGNLFYDSDSDSYYFGVSDIGTLTARHPNELFTLDSFQMNVIQTPEPGSLLLFGSGLMGFAGLVKRRLAA